jgi:hypothetical protein
MECRHCHCDSRLSFLFAELLERAFEASLPIKTPPASEFLPSLDASEVYDAPDETSRSF